MKPIDIADRTELFIDDHLLDHIDGLRLTLHAPIKKEVVLESNVAPEGAVTGGYRMMYR